MFLLMDNGQWTMAPLGTKRPREPVSLSSWHLYWWTLAMINTQLKLQITYFKLFVGRRKCKTIKSGQEGVGPDVEWGLKCVLLTKWGHSCMKERTLVGGKMTPTVFFTASLSALLCVCARILYKCYYSVGGATTSRISDSGKSNMQWRPGIQKASFLPTINKYQAKNPTKVLLQDCSCHVIIYSFLYFAHAKAVFCDVFNQMITNRLICLNPSSLSVKLSSTAAEQRFIHACEDYLWSCLYCVADWVTDPLAFR